MSLSLPRGIPQGGISAQELVDQSALGSFHWRVFGLCALVMLLDGYDLAALGFVVPSIAAEWNLPASSFGLALSGSLIGVAFGSIFAGWLGDRLGRRISLLAMFFIGGAASLATALCENVPQLLACRFVTGIGMGGTIPNAIALVSEYAPRGRRTFLVVLVYSCAALGSTLGSLLASAIIPAFGWQSVFVVGGVLPFVIAAACWRWLPESLPFLVARRSGDARIEQLARALDPARPARAAIPVTVEASEGAGRLSLHLLFTGWLRLATPLLWVLFICTQALVFFLASWLSTILTVAGLPLEIALRALALLHFGGMAGGLLVSWLSDRLRPELLLACNYAAAVVTLLILGAGVAEAAIVLPLSFLVGTTVIGSSFCLGAFASSCYPSQVRATGVGWGLGIGRAGSVTSPLLGGAALAAGMTATTLVSTLAVPAALCSAAVLVLWRLRRAPRPGPPPARRTHRSTS